MDYEAIIVGGGAAGLSAALVLGRCGRRTLVCDDGQPRNAVSRGVHGFLTRDGLPPAEFLRIARAQALAYPTVTLLNVRVDDAERIPDGFTITLANGERRDTRKLLLATGLIDELPEIEGFKRFWGHSAFICPFCDGWEVRGQRMAVYGRAADVYGFAVELVLWSRDLIVCTDGPAPFSEEEQSYLQRLGIVVCEKKLRCLEGEGRQLERLRFVDESVLECRVLFLTTRQRQRSPLPEKLGCPPDSDGQVPVDDLQRSRRRGVFVAGNAADGLQAAILAAAEGYKAAYAINEELLDEFVEETCRELPAGSA